MAVDRDSSMSEDDVPLASQTSTTANGTNGTNGSGSHVAKNGNGRARDDSPMDEDDEDDMPLVCSLSLYSTHISYRFLTPLLFLYST